MRDLAILYRIFVEIARSFRHGIYQYCCMMSQLMRYLCKLFLSYTIPVVVVAGIAALIISGPPFAGIWMGISLGAITCVKFIIPNFIRTAAFNAAPIITTILPGVAASVLAEGLHEDPTNEVSTALAIAGAATALAIGVQSAAFTPALAAALNAPTSWTSLAATTAVATAGRNAGRSVAGYLGY